MKVEIYGIDFELETEGYTVDELIEIINNKGYVVLDIIADGRDISNISDSEIEALMPIKVLEINAKKVEEVLLETLAGMKEFIPDFIGNLDQISVDLTIGKEEEGYNKLALAMDTLDWLNQFLSYLNSPEIVIKDNLKERKALLQQWYETIHALDEALDNQDKVLISDIIEYELKPVLENYLKYVRDLDSIFTGKEGQYS